MREAADRTEARRQAVLVVEDETMIRMMLVDELEYAGYAVIEAENADIAILKLQSHAEIGVVVTDVRMPGSMDGLGLATWMSEHRSWMPIIITSGLVTLLDVVALNPAIARIVGKPYKPTEAPEWLEAIGLAAGAAEDRS